MIAANLRSGSTVRTTKGQAVFIGFFRDGHEAQVSRKVPATEFNREQCEARNLRVREMSPAEFSEWKKNAHFLVNEVIPVGEINGVI